MGARAPKPTASTLATTPRAWRGYRCQSPPQRGKIRGERSGAEAALRCRGAKRTQKRCRLRRRFATRGRGRQDGVGDELDGTQAHAASEYDRCQRHRDDGGEVGCAIPRPIRPAARRWQRRRSSPRGARSDALAAHAPSPRRRPAHGRPRAPSAATKASTLAIASAATLMRASAGTAGPPALGSGLRLQRGEVLIQRAARSGRADAGQAIQPSSRTALDRSGSISSQRRSSHSTFSSRSRIG